MRQCHENCCVDVVHHCDAPSGFWSQIPHLAVAGAGSGSSFKFSLIIHENCINCI